VDEELINTLIVISRFCFTLKNITFVMLNNLSCASQDFS
jgi:hypothetical protein